SSLPSIVMRAARKRRTPSPRQRAVWPPACTPEARMSLFTTSPCRGSARDKPRLPCPDRPALLRVSGMRILTGLFLAYALAQAQHAHRSAENSKPAELLEGLGSHSHPIATKSELAQKFFDQGLALIYGFNHDEAARLFARAAELDPASPMPHW